MQMDFTIFKAINDLAANHDWLEDPLRFMAQDAQFLFVAVLVALFIARGKWRSVNGRRGVVLAGVSALAALGLAQVIAHIWDRARPYEAHQGVHLFVAPSHDPSFPSDHATAAFALAVAVFAYHRRAGWLMLAMASVVSIARVGVGTHYPTDVVGGALLGTLVAMLCVRVPLIRNLAHRVADGLGGIYEGIADRIFRRSPSGNPA
jgi:undecaprenyl-diphosphatase